MEVAGSCPAVNAVKREKIEITINTSTESFNQVNFYRDLLTHCCEVLMGTCIVGHLLLVLNEHLVWLGAPY